MQAKIASVWSRSLDIVRPRRYPILYQRVGLLTIAGKTCLWRDAMKDPGYG